MIRSVVKSLQAKCHQSHPIWPNLLMQQIIPRHASRSFYNISTETIENGQTDVRCEVEQWHSRNQSCPHPDTFTPDDWHCLQAIASKTQRRKYCRHLFLKAERKRTQLLEKLENQQAIRVKREKTLDERETNDHIVYGLGHSSLFLRYDKKHFNHWRNLKLASAKQYGVKMLVDCSFESQMTAFEQSKVANGIRKAFLANRQSAQPLDLQLCGVKSNSLIMSHFNEMAPMLDTLNLEAHAECYSSMFPKERLVVLTPDSGYTLEYNGNDVYVVSGLVDFASAVPVTLDKARSLGIRTAKLPMHLVKLSPGRSTEMPFFNVVNCVRARTINENWEEILEANTPLEIQYKYRHLSDDERKEIKVNNWENDCPRREIVIDDYGDY